LVVESYLVLIVFVSQQWSLERTSILCCTYFSCLVKHNFLYLRLCLLEIIVPSRLRATILHTFVISQFVL